MSVDEYAKVLSVSEETFADSEFLTVLHCYGIVFGHWLFRIATGTLWMALLAADKD